MVGDLESLDALALDRDGFALFRKHLEERFELAFAPFSGKEPKVIYDYPAAVHMTAHTTTAEASQSRGTQPADQAGLVAVRYAQVAQPGGCRRCSALSFSQVAKVA